VSSGTGFAPIWAIAHAALSEMPDREIVIIAAAKSPHSFYMARALLRLAAFPNVKVVPVLGMSDTPSRVFRIGRPTDFLPQLTSEDRVYATGAPVMVEAVAAMARAAGAPCFSDPFEPAMEEESPLSWARIISSAASATGFIRWFDRQESDVPAV
jgi:3-phenylpropionate/trans-cinnamate dioxygenase ferredoxin reductase subunit